MTTVAISGPRDVRATIDGDEEADAVVVACPPHPKHGGSRTDQRLRAVSDALAERDVACLRFDYGPWDNGRGERRDAEYALDWAVDRYDAVGLFGYSFGAGIALRTAAETSQDLGAVSVLAPAANAADALGMVSCPLQIVYGERDETVDWEPIVSAARERGLTVDALSADHHFIGQSGQVATLVADFLCPLLQT